jgi:hypothetical protein
MDPLTIAGLSLAAIIAGEALLTKMYIVFRIRNRQQEFVSSPVSDTT